jgi:hypothetical protein
VPLTPKLLGRYIAAIKKIQRGDYSSSCKFFDSKTNPHCELSLLIETAWDNNFELPDSFFDSDQCRSLVDAFDKKHNWQDVLDFLLGTKRNGTKGVPQ